jgi:DNA repair protein RecO (recombination protein O)
MLVKTKAIALNYIKYSDSSIIARIYTREYGLLSFMVRGVRKRKSRFPASFFQAFTILDLDISYKPKSNLQSIRELALSSRTDQLHSDIAKSTIALFLAEVLHKTLEEEEQDEKLFDFLTLSIEFLNSVEDSFANFHLIFLLQLSKYLGFYPHSELSKKFFNMESGNFENRPVHEHFLDESQSDLLKALMQTSYLERKQLQISAADRRILLNKLLEYYRLHLPGIGKISSLEILESVFSG